MLAPVVTETDGNNNNNQRKKVKMREKHLTTITAPSARPTTCEVVLAEEVAKASAGSTRTATVKNIGLEAENA
jgi:hypothetical protein